LRRRILPHVSACRCDICQNFPVVQRWAKSSKNQQQPRRLAMRACARADDAAVVFRQDIERLAYQLAELEELRSQVLEAEQKKRNRRTQKHMGLGASSQGTHCGQ
ncbi:hypothetical protein, partial [Bradyrhizobium sp. UFLA05-112]